MTCVRIENGIVCLDDGCEGSAVVDGRVWRWRFSERFGPLWLRADGEPRVCQAPSKRSVWDAFDRWFTEWRKTHPAPTLGKTISLD